MLDQIKWELIVIDQCQRQRPTISTHCSKIKLLVAHMKLLTINGEIVVCFFNHLVYLLLILTFYLSKFQWWFQAYHNILSLLDPNYKEILTDVDMETSDDTTRTLKGKLSPFIAFEYKYTREIKEYWVPVHLSHMQIEQYCSLLDSNMEVLSSCLRDSSLLHDILTQTQKVFFC